MKQEFERIRAVIGELADVLDMEFPDYVIEEDKSLQYKQMIIKNKDKGQDEAGAAPNARPGQESQTREAANQESIRSLQKGKYFPFDDEL